MQKIESEKESIKVRLHLLKELEQIELDPGLRRLTMLFTNVDENQYTTDAKLVNLLNSKLVFTPQYGFEQKILRFKNKSYEWVNHFDYSNPYSTTTKKHLPYSPYINFNAEYFGDSIVTVTYKHYNLGYGPMHDLLIPLEKPNIFIYHKFRDKNNAAQTQYKFKKVNKWEHVIDLLAEKPELIHESGAQISLWKHARQTDSFYQLASTISTFGLSLAHYILYFHNKAELPPVNNRYTQYSMPDDQTLY